MTSDVEYARNLGYQQKYIARNKDNPEYHNSRREAIRRWRALNPEKQKAHDAVTYALRIGKLVRPPACEWCSAEGRVQAHHHDYSKLLDVQWICSGCHGKEHRRD